MPPQRLMLIVGGGVAAGLLWRKFSGKSAASANPLAADAADGSLSYPDDYTGYPMDTTGNQFNRRDTVSDSLFPPAQQLPNVEEVVDNTPDEPTPKTMDVATAQAMYGDNPSFWSTLSQEAASYYIRQGLRPPAGAAYYKPPGMYEESPTGY